MAMKLAISLLSSLLCLLILPGPSEAQIAGIWKIRKATIAKTRSGQSLTIDLADLKKSQKDIETFFSKKYREEGGFGVAGQAGQILSSLRRTRLSFLDSQRFFMETYGMMIPKVIPGYHFGDTVSGKWSLEDKMLTLSIGQNPNGPSFRYRIVAQHNNLLTLAMIVSPEGEEGEEYILVRE